MKAFRELSRRGRLYRLRILAKMALTAYGLDGALLSFLQYGENTIYHAGVPDSSGLGAASPYVPNRYVLRIHGMDDAETIASELTWLVALNQEAGLHMPAPMATPEGELLSIIYTPGTPRGRVVSLMRWLDGRRLRQGLRPKNLTELGQMVAQLHNFSADWQPPAGFSRPDWDLQLGGNIFEHSL